MSMSDFGPILPLGSRVGNDEVPLTEVSRADHLAWCKSRALEYIAAGDGTQAFTSMGSDLGKHPETVGHPGIKLGMMQLMAGQLDSPEAMRRFIEGFN